MTPQAFWLAFSLVPDIGVKRLGLLLDWFGDLERAWSATESQLRQAGLDERPLQSLLASRQTLNIAQEVEKVARVGAQLVTLADAHYPPHLRKLHDAPAVLYVRGQLMPEDERALSVVGTRRASPYGREAAYQLARQLAAHGTTVISGLAHGIDSQAHQGALDGGGRTLAVLGCGIDRIYPADNQKLAHRILGSGALVSEFRIGTPPEGRNFPRRNRVISGMGLGVLIVEAPEKSGAMITASVALEQGKDVFAVPGNIFSPSSAGSNRLIQDGAKLVTKVEDILDEFELVHEQTRTRRSTERLAPSNPIESHLLELLTADPLHVDELVRMSGLNVSEVTSTLTILELKGLARAAGYMQYCLIHDL